MNPFSKITICIILIFAFFSGNCQYFDQSDDQFQKLTIESGLSKNEVNCILRDKTGFVWIGTGNGLNRFDGKNVEVFERKIDGKYDLRNVEILDLYEDNNQIIWIGSEKGLLKYNSAVESFKWFPFSENSQYESSVLSIEPENDSLLWLGTQTGLKLFETKSGIVKEEYRRKPYQPYSLSADNVLTICSTDENVWVGTTDGVNVFDKKEKVFKRYYHDINDPSSLGSNVIRKIIQDVEGRIWLGSEYGGLSLYDEKKDNFRSFNVDNSDIPHNDVRDIYDLKDGNLWLATNGGGLSLFNINQLSFTNYSYDPLNVKGLANNAVYNVFEDYEGILWVGFYAAGVNYSASDVNNFKSIIHLPGNSNSICEDNARSLYLDSENDLWIGTLGGLSLYSSEDREYKSFISDPSRKGTLSFTAVTTICRDSDDNIWVGTYSGGVNLKRANSNRFKHYRYDKFSQNSISSDNVYCIIEDSAKDIWVGTSSGFNLYDKENDSWIRMFGGSIRDIVEGKNEKLYIASGGGIVEFNKSSKAFKRHTDERLSRGTLITLNNDNNEKLWFGTQGDGFGFLDVVSEKFKIYNTDDGLPSNFIASIEDYGSKYLWISTYKGISLFNKETETFINYGMTEGLPFFEFHPRSSAVLPDGNIAFGGANGVVFFDPDKVINETRGSKLMFSSLKIDGNLVEVEGDNSPITKNIHLVDELKLKYGQNDFSFDFVDINFKNLGKGEYAYKLEGYMNDWSHIGSQNSIGFTNMDPGEYVLKVRKIRGNFQEGFHEEISMKIEIVSPFWMTWYFYVLLGLLFISIFYLYSKYTLISISQKNEIKLKNLEYEKYEEFNRLRMKFFTYISHELRTPLSLIVDPLNRLLQSNKGKDNRRYLQLIESNSQRLEKLVNQILDFRKLENDTLNLVVSKRNITDVISKIFVDFEETAKKENINYRFDNKIEQDAEGWLDSDKLEKMMYNLLANAFKFTNEEGEVVVGLSNANVDGHIEILIRDNGAGIRQDKLQHIFDYFYSDEKLAKEYKGGVGIGLTYVKRLVDLHHGKIAVESKPNNGTTFTISLPITEEAYSVKEISNVGYEKDEIEKVITETESDKELDDVKHGDNVPLILIAEDETDLRKYLARHLGQKFKVVQALNGKDALEKLKKNTPDLILSDNVMPIMDGISFCNELKSLDEYSHIPFVFLSAWNSDDFKLKGLKVGAEDYISKPFNYEILETKISNLIEKRRRFSAIADSMLKVSPQKVKIETSDERFILKAQEIIEQNIDNLNFTTKQFEEELSMSHSVVYRKIKKLTGLSANEYIREFRIRRAAQIIEQDKNLSVLDVSIMVGFNDQKYFSRCFKNIIGIYPSEYSK